ncbi:reverse transcriptase domain-containing protein [Tanacetum coccineum]
MAISVILVSSDSSEDSVGTSVGRVILFGTIPTTIPETTPSVISPTTHIDTILIPTVSPTIPPSPDYTPASPDYSPVSDTEFNPSEDPSHVASGALRRRVMILALGQPIPHGRPYRYHLNGPIHMMTVRKRVGSLPTHHLVVRHSVEYSSLDHFSSDDSLRDLSSSSSSETSSDSSADALSDFASSTSIHRYLLIPDTPPYHSSSSASPSRKRSRSPVASISLSSSVPGALSSARADLLPSPKRIRSPETDAEIDECIAYADALRARGIDARVVVKAVDREEIEASTRGPVEVIVDRVTHPVIANDIPEPAQEGAVEVTYETLGDLVQRFHDHTEEISVHRVQAIESLERDNMRLRYTMDVVSQRVTPSQRRELRVQREMRQIRRQDLVPLLETGVNRKKVNGNGNGGNGNGGNGNGNGNGRGNGYNFGGFLPAQEYTYKDFLKCQPLNFNVTEGVFGLTRWFEKMETVFHISNCPKKYQVKYATCTLLNSALTWWNSHKRTIGIEAAYVMSWAELRKLMTEVYCPRNEVQKMETELWNWVVKGNDLTAYTRRF